jgi:predicted PurR-regulated permease PerM
MTPGEPPYVDPAGWTRRRTVFLTATLALLLLVVWLTREVLLPFLLAGVIAYVLTPLVALCERAKVPRALAIILVYAATFSVIYTFGALTAPRIYAETAKLARDAPVLVRELSTKWGPRIDAWVAGLLDRSEPARDEPPRTPAPAFEVYQSEGGEYGIRLGSGFEIVQEGQGHWRIVPGSSDNERFSVVQLANKGMERFVGYLKKNTLELIKLGHYIISKIARSIFLLFMTLMVAGYLMHTRDAIVEFLRSLPPPRARLSFDRLLWRMDRGLAGVVRGQLLICAVNGVLSAIGFWMFGLKYWPVLALVAAVMSIIPIFGSILSTIPACLIGLTQDFWTALWVLLWVIGIHQIEANLLNPKIIGVAARIHPVLVVFALLVGEHFYGLWGALLAVPALSLAQSLFNHFRFEATPDSMPDSLLPPDVAARRRA